MLLTISKKIQFAASYQLREATASAKRPATMRGANFSAYFVFSGPVDEKSGMMINVTLIKQRIGELFEKRYDHRFFNADCPPFDEIEPTVTNIARQLLLEAAPLFEELSANLIACHLTESNQSEATAYIDGRVDRHDWISFSAARRTYSPHLSDEENSSLFGTASSPSGHGHYYRLRLTTEGAPVDDSLTSANSGAIVQALRELHALLDHKNLNLDVKELADRPMTTEFLSGWIYRRLNLTLTINRVRLWENPFFAVECCGANKFALSVEKEFQAAHRLHSPRLTDSENLAVYGKCNNLAGHGHRYRMEATIEGDIDARTGCLFSLGQFEAAIEQALKPWDGRFLDRDTDDFCEIPSTGENIICLLKPRLESSLGRTVSRLRLWETDNNRFTLRS